MFQIVKKMLSDDICKVVEQYCLFNMLNEPDKVENESEQVPGTHSVHGDILTESLLLYMQPKIENVIGWKLIPTYSYYRVYRRAAERLEKQAALGARNLLPHDSEFRSVSLR